MGANRCKDCGHRTDKEPGHYPWCGAKRKATKKEKEKKGK